MVRMLEGYRVVVVTVSDRCSRGEQVDLSGPAVAGVLESAGAVVVEAVVVADELEQIEALLEDAAEKADLVVTTGGTGLGPRDVTPEATLAVCERMVPGLAERMRLEGYKETPFAALSRGVCGVCGGALIVNLPGSPRGAKSSLETVLPLLGHGLGLLAGKH